MVEAPLHTDVEPEIGPGVEGADVETDKIFNVEDRLLTPQTLFAVTEIDPVAVPAVALIEFVVLLPLQPESAVGSVQV